MGPDEVAGAAAESDQDAVADEALGVAQGVAQDEALGEALGVAQDEAQVVGLAAVVARGEGPVVGADRDQGVAVACHPVAAQVRHQGLALLHLLDR